MRKGAQDSSGHDERQAQTFQFAEEFRWPISAGRRCNQGEPLTQIRCDGTIAALPLSMGWYRITFPAPYKSQVGTEYCGLALFVCLTVVCEAVHASAFWNDGHIDPGVVMRAC